MRKKKNLKIIKTTKELIEAVNEVKKTKTIGLVPTMGALHGGHLSLIKKSVNDNDFTIVSDFVNPTQFGPNEDYERYPRTLEEDAKLCKDAGCDILFAPSPDEMYSNMKDTTLVCPSYNDVSKLCGKSRPGHFDGVATIVSKLFNLAKPNRAYFGQKDAQQLFIIKKMVRDLNFDIEIIGCPIVRESDGLALSSRNRYLNEENRKRALKLSKALFTIKDLYKNGVNSAETLIDTALTILDGEDIDYFEILDLSNFEKIDIINKDCIALCAVRFPQKDGTIRLIDNMVL